MSDVTMQSTNVRGEPSSPPFSERDREVLLKKHCAVRLSNAVSLSRSKPEVWRLCRGRLKLLEFNEKVLPNDFDDYHDALLCPFNDPDDIMKGSACSRPARCCIIRDYWAEAAGSRLIASSISADNGQWLVLARDDNTNAQKRMVSEKMVEMVQDSVRQRAAIIADRMLAQQKPVQRSSI